MKIIDVLLKLVNLVVDLINIVKSLSKLKRIFLQRKGIILNAQISITSCDPLPDNILILAIFTLNLYQFQIINPL